MGRIICWGLFIVQAVAVLAQNTITVDNATGQVVIALEYWLGRDKEAYNPGLVFKSKGPIERDNHAFVIGESFHKKKRNTILLKATLAGGGFVRILYNIGAGETAVKIKLLHPGLSVPAEDFQNVLAKFRQFRFDRDFLKISSANALQSLLGALYLMDEKEEKILYIVTPTELKSALKTPCAVATMDKAEGVFSSSTAISGGLSLPFVDIGSSFDSGDVCKFTWKVENAGECVWAPPEDADLATLFSRLSEETKRVLLQSYIARPQVRLKFINRIFVIGRIELETVKSRKVSNTTELNAGCFVTAQGNYSLLDDYRTSSKIEGVVTKADGYFVNGLLRNLYLLSMARKRVLTRAEKERLRREYGELNARDPHTFSWLDRVDEIIGTIMKGETQSKMGDLFTAKDVTTVSLRELSDISRSETER